MLWHGYASPLLPDSLTGSATLEVMPRARRIKQIPVVDRPREKLVRKGASALSDFELLEAIIGSGNSKRDVGSIARQVQAQLSRTSGNIPYETLTDIKGVNIATATKLLAAIELAKRYLIKDAEPLTNLKDLLSRLDDIRSRSQEYFVALSLDGAQRLIAYRTITIGTLDTVLAHPREVFADAIVDRAASIVVAHNHPSGHPEPSQQDITLTQQMLAAGQVLGVPLRDHIIVCRTTYFSFRQHHLL